MQGARRPEIYVLTVGEEGRPDIPVAYVAGDRVLEIPHYASVIKGVYNGHSDSLIAQAMHLIRKERIERLLLGEEKKPRPAAKVA
jgi:hypothetical protein